MKIKRDELQGFLDLLNKWSRVKSRELARVLFLNKRKTINRLNEFDKYRLKIYNSLLKKAEKEDKNFNLPEAEKILDEFRYTFLPKLVEKYSWFGKEGEKKQHIIDGHPHVHQLNMLAYNKEAEEEYKKGEAKLKKEFTKEFDLLETVSKKSEDYIKKETTISIVKIDVNDLPESISESDMEELSFMIGGLEDDEKV